MILDASIRIRCRKDLVKRLKEIANTKNSKYQRDAREAIERYVRNEEAKAMARRAQRRAA